MSVIEFPKVTATANNGTIRFWWDDEGKIHCNAPLTAGPIHLDAPVIYDKSVKLEGVNT